MQAEIVEQILAADPGVSVQTLGAARPERAVWSSPDVLVVGTRTLGLLPRLRALLADDPQLRVVAVEADHPEGLIYELSAHHVTRVERWADRLVQIVASAARAAGPR